MSTCIEATGATNNAGYCNVKFNGEMVGAHRVAYIQNIGPIPTGLYVLHKCDNRKCINPEHLFLGTAQDNMNDKTSKGRQTKGSAHWNWKGGVSKDIERKREMNKKSCSEHYYANTEKYSVYMKDYYIRNRERILKRKQEYRLRVKERA